MNPSITARRPFPAVRALIRTISPQSTALALSTLLSYAMKLPQRLARLLRRLLGWGRDHKEGSRKSGSWTDTRNSCSGTGSGRSGRNLSPRELRELEEVREEFLFLKRLQQRRHGFQAESVYGQVFGYLEPLEKSQRCTFVIFTTFKISGSKFPKINHGAESVNDAEEVQSIKSVLSISTASSAAADSDYNSDDTTTKASLRPPTLKWSMISGQSSLVKQSVDYYRNLARINYQRGCCCWIEDEYTWVELPELQPAELPGARLLHQGTPFFEKDRDAYEGTPFYGSRRGRGDCDISPFYKG